MGTIVTQYSGDARRWPQELAGDSENMRIIHVSDDGTKKTVLFEGEEFSESKFLEKHRQIQSSIPPTLPDEVPAN